MDFIDGLPQSGSVNCILVIVDKLTKFAHFLPLAHPYTASKVALLYMNKVYDSMDSQVQSSLIATQFLLATSGRNCSSMQAQESA